MNKTVKMENRIIPYQMLLKAMETTYELVKKILPEVGIPSLKIGLEEMITVVRRDIERAKQGVPIVGYHFAFQADYLKCFECVPICIEGVSYFLGTLLINGVEKYYDMIGNWGHPFHTCSAQKGAMGMSLENLYQFDAIITPTAPCDSTCASYPFFKFEKKFPMIIADMPFVHNEESYRYYAEQLKLSLHKLGEIIGQKPDFEKMRKAIEIENEVSRLRMELFDLIKAIPSPIENIFNAVSAASTILISGAPENISFYKRTLEIVKKRYKKKEHHGGEEKIRSIWPYMLTFFDISLCEWLDRNLGMSVLLDIFNYNLSDPINAKSDLDTLFYGMASKAMGWPMIKQSTEFYYPFLDDCIRMAKDFSADCFIYTQSIACKQFGGVPQLLKEALMDEVGIPMLIIDFDVGDARMTSAKTFKEKISMFAQTLL
ncbi:MAG: 2-hydroxyacyl-CoA dehydratase family protein [Candidatus Hermodarchaeota archaeon]